MKLEITKAQLLAIINLTDDISGMIGCAYDEDNVNDTDVYWKKQVQLIDRMLKKNGYKRSYK